MKPAKVPNDVQREDQILFFITLKQLIMLLVGGGISYMLFTSITKSYDLNEFQHTLIWIPFAFSAVFAFVKIKGMTTLEVILLVFEKIFRPPRRYWVQCAGTPFISLTTSVKLPKDKKEKEAYHPVKAKDVAPQKIKNLATLIDGANSGETFGKHS